MSQYAADEYDDDDDETYVVVSSQEEDEAGDWTKDEQHTEHEQQTATPSEVDLITNSRHITASNITQWRH